jgi:hypothetical protein
MRAKMMKIGLLVCLLVCLPAIVLAQDKPTPAETQKVIQYYYQGKGQGVILMAHKLCAQILSNTCRRPSRYYHSLQKK